MLRTEIFTRKREFLKLIRSSIDPGVGGLIILYVVGMNLRNNVKSVLVCCKTGRDHLRVFLMYLLEEIEPDTRPGRVAHIAHLADPTHDAFLSFPGSVRCVEVFLERVKKSDEECVAGDPVLFRSSGKFGCQYF